MTEFLSLRRARRGQAALPSPRISSDPIYQNTAFLPTLPAAVLLDTHSSRCKLSQALNVKWNISWQNFLAELILGKHTPLFLPLTVFESVGVEPKRCKAWDRGGWDHFSSPFNVSSRNPTPVLSPSVAMNVLSALHCIPHWKLTWNQMGWREEAVFVTVQNFYDDNQQHLVVLVCLYLCSV